jgi:hypothetical protein
MSRNFLPQGAYLSALPIQQAGAWGFRVSLPRHERHKVKQL